ncbi:hypothetical protein FRC03_008830 [Tulasnella sp. 419]|nr:hypothetical protein FRC03_008830 [Tulasnella sp. 419]
MSALLQDVLRPHTEIQVNEVANKLGDVEIKDRRRPTIEDSSEEDNELIGVMSVAATPHTASRVGSKAGSRSQSPTKLGASARKPLKSLYLSPDTRDGQKKPKSTDPLRVLPTEISQRIFGMLTIKQLARCARVSRKWKRSQTLNYVWFQHWRKENFQDASLPPGKWTRKESKQDWRNIYIQNGKKQDRENTVGPGRSPYYALRADVDSPIHSSGYQTPREIREEKWKAESEVVKPGKNEMRELYKELGGRKPKTKGKFQTGTTSRDKGGWESHVAEGESS